MRIEVSLVRDRAIAANVVAVLPGADARLAHEAIVIGAHYDHLGRGGEGSLAPDQAGAVHPGADDNASGTAAVMALARAFASAPRAPRTLVFVAFAGEEMGLLGSTHFVRAPPLRSASTVLMVNLDMVGRLRDGKVYVGGVDSGDSLRAWITDAARGLALTPELRGDPFGPSDHIAFYAAGVPVVFLFTGAHGDYHRPSDTWDKLNPQGLELVTAFTARIVAAAAGAAAAPAYVRAQPAPAAEPRRGGIRPGLRRRAGFRRVGRARRQDQRRPPRKPGGKGRDARRRHHRAVRRGDGEDAGRSDRSPCAASGRASAWRSWWCATSGNTGWKRCWRSGVELARNFRDAVDVITVYASQDGA